MPNTNASEPSSDTTSDAREHYFLIDYATMSADASQAITTILDTIEANELYQSKSRHVNNPEADALALSDSGRKSLQKLALLTARLLGNYAVQEIELIEARSQDNYVHKEPQDHPCAK